MIRKISLCLFLFVTSLTAKAQNKDVLFDKIENSYSWLKATLLRNNTNLNLTEEQWAYALKNEFVGIDMINSFASGMANYFEITVDDRIASDCNYGKGKASCEEKLNNLKSLVQVEMNMQTMPLTPERFKLATYALSTLGEFLGNNNNYGVKAGYRPKGKSVKFILNIDNGKGQPVVVWNPDGTVATIKMPIAGEVGDWHDNMLKGLEKGFVKK